MRMHFKNKKNILVNFFFKIKHFFDLDTFQHEKLYKTFSKIKKKKSVEFRCVEYFIHLKVTLREMKKKYIKDISAIELFHSIDANFDFDKNKRCS